MTLPSVTKRALGSTGLQLSSLGLGTAGLGDLFQPVTDVAAQVTVDQAWSSGCRYFDTSPFYGHGQAEIRTGRGLYKHEREELVLSTKVGRLFRRPADPATFENTTWVGGLPFELTFDYSYDGIMRSVEDSYLRLGMNRIDILLIHDLDRGFHPDPDTLALHRNTLLTSGWKALQELKSAGVIGAVGAGLNDRETMRWYLDYLEVDCFLLALRYTLLEHGVLLDELPRCEANDVGIIVGGAFNSGILATGAVAGAKYNYDEAPAEILDKVRKIEAICERHHTPLAAAALQFPAAHPLVASVVVGALQPEHVTSNIESFDMTVPGDLWAELKDVGLLPQSAPVPASTTPIQKEVT
jgi:D-threo-aldose 1-dehydrogenase